MKGGSSSSDIIIQNTFASLQICHRKDEQVSRSHWDLLFCR